MILPTFRGEVTLPLDSSTFFTRLGHIITRLGEGRDYRLDRTGPHSVRIMALRFSPFGYRFNRATVETQPLADGGIKVRYSVSFLKWFLAMLLLVFQLLIAFSVVAWLYVDRLSPDVQSEAFVTLIFSLAFWAILWPLGVTVIYRIMVNRVFRTIILSAGIGSFGNSPETD